MSMEMECHPEIDRCPLDYEIRHGVWWPPARTPPDVLRQAEIDNYTCVCGELLPDLKYPSGSRHLYYPGAQYRCECGAEYMVMYGFRRLHDLNAWGWHIFPKGWLQWDSPLYCDEPPV